MSVEVLSSGEGRVCLELASLWLDLVFPFFSCCFSTLLSERRLAFPARLLCWAAPLSTARSVREEPPLLCLEFSHLVETFCLVCLLMRPPRYLCTRSTWQHPKSQLGSCRAQTPHGVPGHQLMSDVSISREIELQRWVVQAGLGLDGAINCSCSTTAFNEEWR